MSNRKNQRTRWNDDGVAQKRCESGMKNAFAYVRGNILVGPRSVLLVVGVIATIPISISCTTTQVAHVQERRLMRLLKKKQEQSEVKFTEHEERCHSGDCPCFLDGQKDIQTEMDDMVEALKQFTSFYDRKPNVEKTTTQRDTAETPA